MNIISAHQQGLIEQLHQEASALAGRPGDHAQRAVALHHLYQHSRGCHHWALAEARQELRVARGISALRSRLDRWGWTISRRGDATWALDRLADALRESGRARTLAAYLAYRLSATAALRAEAERQLPAGLLTCLDQCHAARRERSDVPAETSNQLAAECEAFALASVDCRQLALAWEAVASTGLKRAACRLLGDKGLARAGQRDAKRGWRLIEQQLRNDVDLPASFRANPAQHFYALQHVLTERRRQQWRDACDREPGAFALAA